MNFDMPSSFLPGTSMHANKLSFLSLRATLNTNLQAPVKFDPVTSNCEHMTYVCGCVCMLNGCVFTCMCVLYVLYVMCVCGEVEKKIS